ncbi:MAG TPA: arylesterase [Puia sp.]|nr:arylesterase [Puia sp.]
MFNFRHAIFPVIISLLAGCHNNNTRPAVTAGDSLSSAPAAAAAKSIDSTHTVPAAEKTKTILFYGNSLTAGYGLSPDQSFPALIGHRLDSLRLPYKSINAGLSGETSAGGLTRIGWVLRQPVNIFVLELGGNDGLRGIPLNSTRDNLQAIIDTVRKKYPSAKIVLAGMQIPPNMGEVYSKQFHDLFPALAKKNNLTLIPFLLRDVGGIPALNQGDGIHPNVAGEKIVTETVWKYLRPLL